VKIWEDENSAVLGVWKGYSTVHDSWEPATNVHTPALVKDYYKAKGTSAVKVISPPVHI